MEIWEIENHGTGDKACFGANTVEEIDQVLLSKGYTCILKHEVYAGNDDNGNEISVMAALIPHVTAIKTLSEKGAAK
jgi:hypothetical protein